MTSDIIIAALLGLGAIVFYRLGVGRERDRWEGRRFIINDAREIARAKNRKNK